MLAQIDTIMENIDRTNPFTVRRLRASDAAAYRSLRLEGLCKHPEAFSASWDDENRQPVPWFAQRLESNWVIGGWLNGSVLAGTVGLAVPSAHKLQHKGILWGVYVCPEARGTGLAKELLRQLVAQARTQVEEVLLTVAASNIAARDLYKNFGFKEYGLEHRALKIDGRYYDEVLMALPLTVECCPTTTRQSS